MIYTESSLSLTVLPAIPNNSSLLRVMRLSQSSDAGEEKITGEFELQLGVILCLTTFILIRQREGQLKQESSRILAKTPPTDFLNGERISSG